MKNIIYFFIALAIIVGVNVYFAKVRDPQLLALCADNTTKTLYECK
jgi:hypothetical protein